MSAADLLVFDTTYTLSNDPVQGCWVWRYDYPAFRASLTASGVSASDLETAVDEADRIGRLYVAATQRMNDTVVSGESSNATAARMVAAVDTVSRQIAAISKDVALRAGRRWMIGPGQVMFADDE